MAYEFHILLDQHPEEIITEKKMLPNRDVILPSDYDTKDVVLPKISQDRMISARETARNNRTKKKKYKKECYNPKKDGQNNIFKY